MQARSVVAKQSPVAVRGVVGKLLSSLNHLFSRLLQNWADFNPDSASVVGNTYAFDLEESAQSHGKPGGIQAPDSKHGSLRLAACVGVASLVGSAADLLVSALNGYYVRVDKAWLLLIEWAGVFGCAALAILGVHVAARLTRRPDLARKASAAICLFGASVPVALVLLWRHRDLEHIAALVALGLAIVGIAIREIRSPRSPLGNPLTSAIAVIASACVILWCVTVPFPGRDLLASTPASGAVYAQETRPNLLFIVADTVRADHVGAYGYHRNTTPWLDSFASNATLFENAISASSYTLPSHATLFTGLYPETHGAIATSHDTGLSLKKLGMQPDFANVSPLTDEVTTLAEILREEGYQTAAMCANTAYLAPAFNLDQGFDTYVNAMGSLDAWRPFGLTLIRRVPLPGHWRILRMLRSSERYYIFGHEINELALTWMKSRSDAPYFLFLNYMDPHWPYLPLPGYRNLFPHAYDRMSQHFHAVNEGHEKANPEEVQTRVDAYDAGIRTLDDRLKELFSELESSGALENTCVVIVSDHGEAFGEHGKFEHHQSVYQEEVHIPLILKLPGQVSGQRVSRYFDMTDVMPTVLASLGMTPPNCVEGKSRITSNRVRPVIAFLGNYERDFTEHAVIEAGLKLIVRSDAPPKLFDLTKDPGEQVDLSDQRHADVARLMAMFDAYVHREHEEYEPSHSVDDPETTERLRALGYLSE